MSRFRRYLPWSARKPGEHRPRIALLWPLLVLLALLVGFLQLLTTGGGATATPTPQGVTATPTPPPFVRPSPGSLQQATFVAVVDGDTIDVMIDGAQRTVRYYGIDAPDKGEKCFEEAKDRNTELMGATLRLEAGGRDQDEDGRLLRYVFKEDGVSVEAVLLAEGLAEAQHDNAVYRQRFEVLETDAREARVGCLWK